MQLLKQVEVHIREIYITQKGEEIDKHTLEEFYDIPAKGYYVQISLFHHKDHVEMKLEYPEWERIKENSRIKPKIVGAFKDRIGELHYLYQYRNIYYLSDIDMTEDDVLLVLKNASQTNKDRLAEELDKIKAKAEAEGGFRAPIPEDVQVLVWNRDGGKCVKCGGVENLEFDHIIPLSKGGSNTARNIQLLCEHCNRSKGAKIGS